MILSKRVALGGVQLDEIDPSIVIRSVDPGTTKETMQTASRMGGSGQRVTMQHFDTLEPSVTYAIDLPKKRMAERRAVFDAVNAWALKKGWLAMNCLEGRRAYIDAVTLPSSGDLWNWTEEFQITFKAIGVPFWQDESPAKVSGKTAAAGTVTVQVGGNTQSVLNATFQNKSGKTINNFTITANGNTISLAGISLGGSATLTISHSADGLLQIRAGSTSVYEKYTGADDLYVEPGDTAVSWTADRAGILTVQSYGRWR